MNHSPPHLTIFNQDQPPIMPAVIATAVPVPFIIAYFCDFSILNLIILQTAPTVCIGWFIQQIVAKYIIADINPIIGKRIPGLRFLQQFFPDLFS